MTQSTKNKITDLIFRNVRIIALLFLFIVVFGTISFTSLERQGFPDVSINIALVTAPYPNASAAQIEDQVMKPLETVLSRQDSVTEYETISNDNFAMAVVTFDDSKDLDASIAALNNDISAIKLPEDALDFEITKISAGGASFMVSVSGPQNSWELYSVTQDIRSAFENIEGIDEVTELNPLTPEIIITFDDEVLAKNELSREAIEGQITTAQFELPVGAIVNDEGKQTLITIAKDLNSIIALKELAVGPDLSLQDVATVELRLENHDKYNRVGFRYDEASELEIVRSIVLSIDLDKDADILTVDDLLKEKMEELSLDSNYRSVDTNILYSQAEETRKQIDEITSSVFGKNIESFGVFGVIGYLFGAVTMVLLLLFFFMNARVAILAALSIPLSLMSASIYLAILGINLNTLVLFSMVLAIGLVVDPTIVFLESLQRYKEQGFSGRDAAAKTMNTVGWGVTLAVATNVLVFIPFGIVSGFFGQIIQYIPVTIIPAMIASLLIPVVFFTPFASYFLKPKKRVGLVNQAPTNENSEMQGTWWIGKKVGKMITWLLKEGKMYGVIRFFVVLAGLTVPFLVAFVFIQTGAVKMVQFSEPGDVDFLVVYGDLNDSWTFEKSVYDVVVPVQEILTDFPEIDNFIFFEQNGNDFTLLVTLVDFDIRKENDWRRGSEVAEDINAAIATLNLDATVEADTSSDGPPADRFQVKVRVFDDNLDILADASDDLLAFLVDVEGVTAVESNMLSENEEGSVTFVLDNGEAVTQNPFMIYGLVANSIGENDLGKLTFSGQEYDLYTSSTSVVTSIDDLKDVEIPNFAPPVMGPFGEVIEVEVQTIESVIAKEKLSESTTIRRINGERYVQVQAMVDEDTDVFEVQEALDEYLDEIKLEELGLDKDATSFKGEADSITKSFQELLVALAIAIFMIYILLVGFFRSFLEPFIILSAIPLGLIGVFFAIAATTGQMGFLELLGIVAMAGIVVNVTILLIDFANQLQRDEGKSAEEAIATSVAVRFRPIVLTQLTAFGSLMPLMIYSPFWQGLAGSIIFGIVSSALLSLFMTPVLYVWAGKAGKLPAWIRVKVAKIKLKK